MKPGQVIWITGLSGSGKTTIARNLREVLQQKGHSVILIDGDDFRAVVDDPYIGYDIDSRLINANRICRLAKLVSDQGFLTVVATISLFHEIHDWNRQNFSNYKEILIKVPKEIRDKRRADARGKKNLNGRFKNVMGVDQIPEMPRYPDLIIDNSNDHSRPGYMVNQIIPLINT